MQMFESNQWHESATELQQAYENGEAAHPCGGMGNASPGANQNWTADEPIDYAWILLALQVGGEMLARKIQCLQVVRICLSIQLLEQVVIDGGVIET